VPVIGITSDVAVASRGRFPLTELDQQALHAPLTQWNGSIDTAAQLGDRVRPRSDLRLCAPCRAASPDRWFRYPQPPSARTYPP
jgi:hypothetical protein